MTKRTRRTHSAVFKANVALAALGGDKTLDELARINYPYYLDWIVTGGNATYARRGVMP